MGLRLYNTMGREIKEFIPINKGEALVYACGPTVYNYAHIGNLRTYIFEDILRRVLEFSGYKIKHVMNVTDVGHLTDDADSGEDKMEKSARETGKTVWEIANYYTDAFFRDIESLNIQKPEIICRATEHVDEMIDLIKKLEDKGYTYVSGGNVYFSIDKFPDYGKMALLDRQNLQAGSRIEVDSNKKNPHDFVLWFTKSKFENHAMLWDSPWGRGYPGWHIECSAMSMKYLGESFDIHCGGIDHINVHHTNEIAQSEAASGKKWVNYWLHGEFLVMNKSKMAKSAGNFITLTALKEKGYDPLDYRYFCLSGHYRSQLQFSFESLDAARSARVNLVERVKALNVESGGKVSGILSDKGLSYLEDFKAGMEDDLNCPKMLAVFWTMLKEQNLDAGEKLGLALIFDQITGLGLAEKKDEKEVEAELDENVRRLINEREEARKSKDFSRSDAIRNELKTLGIEIKDTPDGTVWKKL
ncbi:MAG: cysteine--tRNA ligase [Spirochaetia bacterium]|jgi:cysteinyl-tRNA synthetase|nr:cysteine--tRNA ligase [Spirochaetia bacterium]